MELNIEDLHFERVRRGNSSRCIRVNNSIRLQHRGTSSRSTNSYTLTTLTTTSIMVQVFNIHEEETKTVDTVEDLYKNSHPEGEKKMLSRMGNLYTNSHKP